MNHKNSAGAGNGSMYQETEIRRVVAAWFSPTGNTGKLALRLGKQLSTALDLPLIVRDLTLPESREQEFAAEPSDLLIFAVPVYAGRVPNKFLPWLDSMFGASGTLAVPMVTFGNRSFQDALSELGEKLEEKGCRILGGCALVCQHAFAGKIGKGRPNQEDLAALDRFGAAIVSQLPAAEEKKEEAGRSDPGREKDRGGISLTGAAGLPGNHPAGPYYTPLGEDGKPAVFLKARPKTDRTRCDRCGRCAAVCPMGSIEMKEYPEMRGICIKCQACIGLCEARYMDDEAFLSHKRMLEKTYEEPQENCFCLSGRERERVNFSVQ